MSLKKKQIRQEFRKAVFERDSFCCRGCGFESTEEDAPEELDAHHINDRNNLPAGGYVRENGITLCKVCHIDAEEFHKTGQATEGFAPEDLYRKIGSSYDLALAASKKLERRLK